MEKKPGCDVILFTRALFFNSDHSGEASALVGLDRSQLDCRKVLFWALKSHKKSLCLV